MAAMDSNKKALEVWIKKYYKADQFTQAQDKAEGDEVQIPTDGPQQSPDISQKYLESRQRFENSKVMEYIHRQQNQMYEDTKPASEKFIESAFLGWCTVYQGTNADSDVPTIDSQVDQNMMGYVRPHQLGSHHAHRGADRGHHQRDGYWVNEQSDHAFHQSDPLRDARGQQELPGDQDHQAEPPGRQT